MQFKKSLLVCRLELAITTQGMNRKLHDLARAQVFKAQGRAKKSLNKRWGAAHLELLRSSAAPASALSPSGRMGSGSFLRVRDGSGLSGEPFVASRRVRLSPPSARRTAIRVRAPSMNEVSTRRNWNPVHLRFLTVRSPHTQGACVRAHRSPSTADHRHRMTATAGFAAGWESPWGVDLGKRISRGAAGADDVCCWHPQTCCRGLFLLIFLTIFMLCTVSRGLYCVPLVL